MARILVPLLIAAGVVIGFGMSGTATALGANPLWATQVTFTGALAGTVLALVGRLALRRRFRAGSGFAVLAMASYGVASLGKASFLASYAENATAGQMWFYGWIGAATLATAAIAMMLFRR